MAGGNVIHDFLIVWALEGRCYCASVGRWAWAFFPLSDKDLSAIDPLGHWRACRLRSS